MLCGECFQISIRKYIYIMDKEVSTAFKQLSCMKDCSSCFKQKRSFIADFELHPVLMPGPVFYHACKMVHIHDCFFKAGIMELARHMFNQGLAVTYLKISEGCDRHCAYCAIPIITGHHQSRPMEDIVAEVEHLVSEGVKEFQVIAQELTYYGLDIYGEQKIAELVERISEVKGVKWIRLHYAYPMNFPWELLKVIRERKNVCKYLDIALQHVSTKVLTNMQRHVNKEDTYALIERIRKEVPGIALRTTLMVGFPGEGEAEFEELKEFVRWARFDRMGAFAYSEEEGTPAQKQFEDEVSDEVKQQRLSELMDLQQDISAEVQAEKVGQTLKVIIDRKEGEYYVGRTEFDSPEVDPEVLIPVADGILRKGSFYNVHIVDSDDFDLYGKVTK